MEKILATNEKKVTKLLESVQGSKSMVRTINYSDIQEAVKYIYKHFDGVPKKHMSCGVNYSRHASIFPACYKYSPMGTEVCFLLDGGKTYITMISREDCNRKYQYRVFSLSDEMKDDIINNSKTF